MTNRPILSLSAFLYAHALKPVFFQMDPEFVHAGMVFLGRNMGKSSLITSALASVLTSDDPALTQTLTGMTFPHPIGLSAGFDYDANLTQITPSLGFGFHTVGTITNRPYCGNTKPRLGRLPESKSLMVNKGFKNTGAKAIVAKLSGLGFSIPIGISIGRTNTSALSQTQSIYDIVAAFERFEKSSLTHSYYELNISCPNLKGKVDFYSKKHLKELLRVIDSLHLTRKLFIKMPIANTDTEIDDMLAVIAAHSPVGVIIGNLQKNRTDSAFATKEVQRFRVGNFSGKPTWNRSNYLIRKTYLCYKDRFIIIGCGGVFSAEDAYLKIRLGAQLVQLITGMIFQGPQLISQINHGLVSLLRRDGFANISTAVGTITTSEIS